MYACSTAVMYDNHSLDKSKEIKASELQQARIAHSQRALRELYSPGALGWLTKHRCVMDYLEESVDIVD